LTLIGETFAASSLDASLLVASLQEGIPEELLDPSVPATFQAKRLAQQLEENRGLTPAAAKTAVETWAYALGRDLPAAPSDKQRDQKRPASSSDSVVTRKVIAWVVGVSVSLWVVGSLLGARVIGHSSFGDPRGINSALWVTPLAALCAGLYTSREKTFALILLWSSLACVIISAITFITSQIMSSGGDLAAVLFFSSLIIDASMFEYCKKNGWLDRKGRAAGRVPTNQTGA